MGTGCSWAAPRRRSGDKNEEGGVNPLADRLRTRVRALCDDFFPRDAGHPEVLARAADHLAASFQTLGLSPRRQEWDAGGGRYANVIAEVGPATEDRIVIGAHYDTAGAQPGADDNASGVAGVLELAALLAARPPSRRVELVAYCLEEAPIAARPQMGSAVHAASLRAEGVRVRLMMALEMIGYFRDAPGSQRYPLPGMGLVGARGSTTSKTSRSKSPGTKWSWSRGFRGPGKVPWRLTPFTPRANGGTWKAFRPTPGSFWN
jgi:hypothetical protein